MVNRILCCLRDWMWDISSHVEWLPDAQPYYERIETVVSYDSVNWVNEQGQISTMKSPVSGNLIALMMDRNAKSVVDVGCGAGAFYHLLKKIMPDVDYKGFDASFSQVSRARKNFGNYFDVRDASELTKDDFGCYDAVHIYSVLSFMDIEKQLKLIDSILGSGACTIIETGATLPLLDFTPRSVFKNSGGVVVDDKLLLTAVSWPYLNQIERIVQKYSDSYELSTEEKDISFSKLVNRAGRDGGALAPRDIKKYRKRIRLLPETKRAKLLMVTIKPKQWVPPSKVYGLEELLEK